MRTCHFSKKNLLKSFTKIMKPGSYKVTINDSQANVNKSEKEQRKKERKERKKRERKELGEKLKKQLESIDAYDPSQRNPILIKIVESYLGRSIQVFENQWQSGTLLSNQILLDTPIFWFKVRVKKKKT